ncbi:hypothetical protein QFC24_000412 [Naganishia onofrii]|uniref:Uncharacterized protein n=1 Tax=Naganishia onofrii TaxID=1851511 RepID=A0ACC2XWV6_9TREE|nr:hypothetical protein QFC24_000412 [Naganishia onofrii]
MARSDDDFVDDNEQSRPPPPIVTQPRRKPITRKRKARHVSTSDNDQDQPQVAKQPRKQTSTNNAGSGREESDDGQQGNDEESDVEVQVPPPMEKPSKPSSKKPRKDPFPRTALPDGIEPDAQGSLYEAAAAKQIAMLEADTRKMEAEQKERGFDRLMKFHEKLSTANLQVYLDTKGPQALAMAVAPYLDSSRAQVHQPLTGLIDKDVELIPGVGKELKRGPEVEVADADDHEPAEEQ